MACRIGGPPTRLTNAVCPFARIEGSEPKVPIPSVSINKSPTIGKEGRLGAGFRPWHPPGRSAGFPHSLDWLCCTITKQNNPLAAPTVRRHLRSPALVLTPPCSARAPTVVLCLELSAADKSKHGAIRGDGDATLSSKAETETRRRRWEDRNVQRRDWCGGAIPK